MRGPANALPRAGTALLCLLFAAVPAGAGGGDGREDALLERARALAHRFVIVDGHVDAPFRHRDDGLDPFVSLPREAGDFDLPRAREGGLDAPFFSIFTPATLQEEPGESKRFALARIGWVEEKVRAHPAEVVLATSPAEVRHAHRSGKLAVLLGMENGSPIEDDVANVDLFFERGVRYVTLAHSKDNLLADSSYDGRGTNGGLSELGEAVVRRMNRLGMLVDVAHLSDEAIDDVLRVSKAPVIASHSSCRFFTPGFERNLDDGRIRRIAAAGGVVMINFGSSFLDDAFRREAEAQREAFRERLEAEGVDPDSEEAYARIDAWRRKDPILTVDVERVADHVAHVAALVGAAHVGLGSDFDGVGPTLPRGLEDVSRYPNLIAVLLRRGFDEREIEGILGGNLLRVWETVERVARGGEGYEDTPPLPESPFLVHDRRRPVAPFVRPADEAGAPPADAIVLFDGADLSLWMGADGGPARWRLVDGAMEADGTGSLRTRRAFADCQLHLEWRTPPDDEDRSQGRGNSGVFLMGRYEIQVLDSFANETYADGAAGALYGQHPPAANTARPPGAWQTYDVLFRAPRFAEDGTLLEPARVTLLWNGVLVHLDRPFLGATVHRALPRYEAHGPAPLLLQDHGDRVRYRNVWIRPLALGDDPPDG